ncbi:MAG: TOBE domain-containing protein [Rhodococcus sp.]|jgi:molybdopterin-binding protein|uniref:TOBE domain-containing protein n=1 Tax=Nocardiaceae TaxID=85025 RepID=UPI00050BDB81|nr:MULTISPECIES: TOBE domain-containing protein [Rhodococcus]KQU31593.1 MerR family transcriptional regulator [Rhodococcus sp. Leaf233]MBJ7320759.1 TOBE domain-containing protein [Rhodococcus sp. (in: high G+C Gram-positive bacteria)]MBJ7349137.1 TOBE domain-containing protein [Rhodococcus sp. (in: high G+C Gram-positive bacteria)]MBW4777908.1 TOBE domain-containing protein [Rhodococcus fascians]MBX5331906.1 TOBE domain-containing protein [Rhodococcus fascians]
MTAPPIRVRDAAALLGVSDDTVRRWMDSGTLPSRDDETGRKVVDARALAQYAREHAAPPPEVASGGSSARNRLVGLVTDVVSDAVMSEVRMQCGPFTIVSLMSTRSVQELGLEPGSITVAVVKATTVIVETP